MSNEPSQFGDRKVKVSTRQIREIRRLVEAAGAKIHSDVRLHREDKEMILGILKRAKGLIDPILQLEMFSPSQLED